MFKYLILLPFLNPQVSDVTYTNTVKKIFDTRCIGCHNNAVPDRNWLTYEAIYKKRALIRYRLKNKTMPPFGIPFEESEREQIIQWIDRGAKK